MNKLLLLFIVGFIGLALRYLVLGEFEVDQLLLLLSFPVGAILIVFIMKRQQNKDRSFQPGVDEIHMVTRLGDRVSEVPKQLYDRQELLGSYKRFYNSRWKRVVADIMDSPGRWFLNLTFSSEDGKIVLLAKNDKPLRDTTEWLILLNDNEVGKIQMDYSVKNVATLNESLYLEYRNQTYHYTSFGIGATTKISTNNDTIAEGKRAELGNSIYALDIDDTYKEEAEILFMGFVLFNYHFSQ
ncbi:hypothetical protein [Bacillus sp. Cs-700]|uniref:tubby C-terminal domain-like protein n=1 Tax=Bacillus sp. Cs-700 TaxID=2589818 RepID=UPI001409EEE3|nr:hypothetical protein [Bacillus sp. Cs-700]